MVRQVLPEFSHSKNVIILCDSWYMKQNLVSIVDEYENLDLIGNARPDSVIYDIAPAPTGHRGRPAKHRRRLSIEDDFTLSDEKDGRKYKVCKGCCPGGAYSKQLCFGISCCLGNVSEVRKCNATVPSVTGLASAWSGFYQGNTCQLDHILCG